MLFGYEEGEYGDLFWMGVGPVQAFSLNTLGRRRCSDRGSQRLRTGSPEFVELGTGSRHDATSGYDDLRRVAPGIFCGLERWPIPAALARKPE